MTQSPRTSRRRKGFTSVSGLIADPVRRSGERRGFAVMRLLTRWHEIVGPDIAAMATPVQVGYAREGFGATLTVLSKGAHAPIVQTMLPQLRERVNACYGYNAISRVRITQTAPAGFEEAQAAYLAKPAPKPPAPPEHVLRASREVAQTVGDEGLRQALEALAQNVLTRHATKTNAEPNSAEPND